MRHPFRRTIGFLLAASLSSCAAEQEAGAPGFSQNVPEWAADAVFYQIFPERFRNGDSNNDPTLTSLDRRDDVPATWTVSSWTGDWYARADWEVAAGDNFYDTVLRRRYGGDLAGVIDRLDYLAELGINAIYFNPLFYARSLHKYDGNTFHHIDPYFGPDPDGDLEAIGAETADPSTWTWTSADRLFLDLLDAARARGIRIIIDGVWNHTGRDFFAFRDVRRLGQASEYRDWYVIESWDDPSTPEDEFDWRGWWGYKPLPEFADTPDGEDLQPGPKQYVFDATRRWMDPDGDGDPSDGIAGWRLDVVPDMPIGFWLDWNEHVRSINPAAYTVAEIWELAADEVARGGFSATMNYYGFAMPVKGFLADNMMSGKAFVDMLGTRLEQYPRANRVAMLNLVDSHDTPRIASMIVNRESDYSEPHVFDYDRDSSPRNHLDYRVRKPRPDERRIQRMIALLQATFVGAPMIYYGTEAGMWGADDPDDRMPMVWEDLAFEPQTADPHGRAREPDPVAFDEELYDFYRRAFKLRHGWDVLRRGDFQPVGVSDNTASFAFVRTLGSESAVVAMNRSADSSLITIPMPDGWRKVSVALSSALEPDIRISENNGTFTVELAPLTGVLLADPRSATTPHDGDE